MAETIKLGMFFDSYQIVGQAPVDFIRGSRSRVIGDRYVTGSWRDPWWAYSHTEGWVVVKRWRNAEQPATRWSEFVPAQDVIVVTPWEGNPA